MLYLFKIFLDDLEYARKIEELWNSNQNNRNKP